MSPYTLYIQFRRSLCVFLLTHTSFSHSLSLSLSLTSRLLGTEERMSSSALLAAAAAASGGDDDNGNGRGVRRSGDMVSIAGTRHSSTMEGVVSRHVKSFVRRTRRGNVVRVAREHYLRDDLPSVFEPVGGTHLLVPDANVALHFMDFIEAERVRNVVVCSTVLEEVRHVNLSAYNRLVALVRNNSGTATAAEAKQKDVDDMEMDTMVLPAPSGPPPGFPATPSVAAGGGKAGGGPSKVTTKNFFVFDNEHHVRTYVTRERDETINDRNDRAIRGVASFLNDQCGIRSGTSRDVTAILLTEDKNSLRVAEAAGIPSMTVVDYITNELDGDPLLMDLVARLDGAVGDTGNRGDAGSKRQRIGGDGGLLFPEHLPMAEMVAGLSSGAYYQGTMKCGRFGPNEGRVAVAGLSQAGDDLEDVNIVGRMHMNRALDGDVVVIQVIDAAAAAAAGDDSATKAEDGTREEREEDAEKAAGIVADVNNADEYVQDVPIDGSRKAFSGRVVGIIKRNWRSRGYAGSLRAPKNVGTKGRNANMRVLFVPMDSKVPIIVIMTRQYDTLKDKRIIVKIDGWESNNDYPHGHYVRTLGVSGDRETESSVVLFEYDISDSPFTPAVYGCLPKLPWSLSDEHDIVIAKPGDGPATSANVRTDLRHLDVCSVDPPGCKDIDDALHCVRLPDDGSSGGGAASRSLYEVGVHIADVTHFMKPNTALDEEASRRCTSTYLVDKRIDMLPKALTEDICSLRGGIDRLAFSVMWTVDYDTGEILATKFVKSIIHSKAALSYVEAQARMDDSRITDTVTVGLRGLNHIAKLLRKKRMEKGALVLASPEVKFQLDTETHDPTDVGVYVIREANQMVEEFMLLANISVAEKILDAFPASSMLRRHPAPTPKMLSPLVASLKTIGIDTSDVDVTSSKSLNACLDGCVRGSDEYFNKLVRIIATRCMTQAQYFSSGEFNRADFRHYGLAMPIYTHFTSPIRRYADDIVHRLLAAAIGIDTTPDIVADKQGLREQVAQLNYRHRNAQMAGRASAELHTVLFFRNKPTNASARIIRVRKKGMVVFIPQYGIEGPVILGSASSSSSTPTTTNTDADASVDFQSDEEKQICTVKGRSFRLFDKCEVKITVEEGQVCRRLVLRLVL